MLLYVTGNKDKFEKAKGYLNDYQIEITQKALNITEPQALDAEEIGLSKASQAHEQLSKSLFITDSSWRIPVLNGFPGPFMAYVNKWFTVNDFLSLMEGKPDRTIELVEVLVFKNDENEKVFTHTHKGIILEQPKGRKESLPSDQIFSFKDGLSIDQVTEKGESNLGKISFWDTFGEWYSEEIRK